VFFDGGFCIQLVYIIVMTIYWGREYWMVYRGPVFLAVVWFGSSHTSPHAAPLSRPGDKQKTRKRDYSLTGKGERGGRGAESYFATSRKPGSLKFIQSSLRIVKGSAHKDKNVIFFFSRVNTVFLTQDFIASNLKYRFLTSVLTLLLSMKENESILIVS
jgi:hypothetical protein